VLEIIIIIMTTAVHFIICIPVHHCPVLKIPVILYKTVEWIEVLFGMETLGDPRHIVLVGHPDPLTARRRSGGGNFANCTETLLLGLDAAFA